MRYRGLRAFGSLRHRDSERQNRARTIRAVARFDAAALRLDEASANRQSETGSGTAAILRLHAIKFVEDPLQIGGRNPRSLVDDFQRDDIAVAMSAKVDTAAGRRILGGV